MGYNKKKIVNKYVEDIKRKMLEIPDEQLCEIYQKLNAFEWDERLGAAPPNYYSLECYSEDDSWFSNRNKITRFDYLRPICDFLQDIVSKKALDRYHHIKNLHHSEEEFETWWRSHFT